MLAVQGKVILLELQGKGFSPLLVLSRLYFSIVCNNVGYHE